MKDTHELVIKADTNDADYITQTTGFVDGQVHFELNEFFSGSPSLTMREFLAGLVNALKALHLECPSQHNWSNEYCEDGGAEKTSERTLFALFGAQYEGLHDHQKEDAIEKAREAISEYLPYGDYGVHTIESIHIQPIAFKEVLF